MHPLPPVAVTGIAALCDGQPTALTASGGNTYLWSTGAATATIGISQTGAYTVTATGAGGCTASAARDVVQSTSPTAGISVDTAICQNGQATLTASGGQTYQWGTGQTTASITVSPPATTAYTVTVANAEGCTGTATATVQVEALPGLMVTGAAQFCAGGATVLTASGNGTFEWSTGATTASITVSAPGSYAVTATAANGCAEADTVAVAELPLPAPAVAPAAPFIGCGTTSATLTAHGGGTYQWSTGQTTASITVSPAATTAYTVTVTGANGCTASETKTVSVPAALSVSVAKSNVTCFGASDGSLTASPAGGTPPYIYTWQKDGLTVGTAQTLASLGPGTYQLTVSDANGCTDTRPSNIVTEPLPLDLSVAAVEPDPGDPSKYRVTVASTGGNAAHRYRRCTAAGSCTAYGTGAVFAGLAPGAWSFWVRDSKGCVDSVNLSLPQTMRPAQPREADGATAVRCWPNPFTDALTVEAGGTAGFEALLLDAAGREVARAAAAAGQARCALATGGLPAGAYTLRVLSEAGTQAIPVALVR